MKYKLYSFNVSTPELGYKFEGEFDSEQECNLAAFSSGMEYYRIELVTPINSVVVYESTQPLDVLDVN